MTMLRARSITTRAERGETLIELLTTVAILGIAVVAIVFGMGVAVKASGTDRKQSRMETLLRNGAEAITAAGYQPAGDYSGLLGPGGPVLATLGPDSGRFVITAALSRCLDTNAAPASCDTGVQELTLTAQSNDGRSSKTLVMVKRNAGVGVP